MCRVQFWSFLFDSSVLCAFFFSSRRRHTSSYGDWSSGRVLFRSLVALTPSPAPAAEERLVVYTAYEENELKDFWDQFKKDLPDLAAKASYIRASTGPIMARVEAEKANPQADVIWGGFNDYLTGAANKGLLVGYQAKESGGVATMFRHPQNLWQGVTLVTVAFAVNQKKMQDLK